MAYPTGSRVTIRSVSHLDKPHKKQHLIGRQGVIGDHENGMNIVAGIGWVIAGYHAFADDDLTVTGQGSAPDMPRRYRLRSYYIPGE
jgi:hypothetical protein